MRKCKKVTSILLATAMVLSLAGCGKGQQETVTEEVTTEAASEEVTEEVTTEEAQGNLITNGDFSDGTNHFNVYTNGGNCNIDVNADTELQVDISKTGSVEHGVQIYYDGFEMKEGVVYQFSFDVHGTMQRDFEWRIQLNGGDYHAYYSEKVNVTEEVQHISTQFTMNEASDPAPRLCFNMGFMSSMEEAGMDPSAIEEHSIMLDNLCLEVVDDSAQAAEAEAVAVPKAKVDQLGYKPNDTKTAVFADLESDDTTFQVVDAGSGEVVYEGTMTSAESHEDTGETNCQGDFSQVTKEGTYKIVTGKGEESVEFTIGENVYDDTFQNVVKMLYLQRCGTELTEALAGDYAHPVCHGDQATIYGTDTKIDVSGGWHDAGDYGRYVVSGAKAVADLLLAYEKNPDAFGDNCGIPESGNGVNDALDEARYELDWMLKMQDTSSGGVYHKVSCKVFPETVMPQDETDELVVCPISKTATEDFAAVMAMASRMYQDVDSDFANRCLEAAKKAWAYYAEHKNDNGFSNPSDVVTGEYPDSNSRDEYFWASAELYKTTEDAMYKDAMADMVDNGNLNSYGSFGWQNVTGYGAYAALTTPALQTDNSNLLKTIETAFFGAADNAVAVSQKNGYLADKEDSYEWGSNMGVANSGMLLCLANEIKSNEEYVACAKNQLHYLFGVNATGYCFVTGAGTLSPENPHHRPSQVLEKCMPGMLVGGPDSALEDPYAQAVFTETPAAKCYADNAQSYSCNEVTIYWNSPLIYLMAATEE